MNNEFLKRIADDDEPIRVMLAMLKAVNEFSTDLATDEPVDASEGLTGREIDNVIKASGKAVEVIEKMYRRLA